MKCLLIIGCGDIALRTIPLLKQRYRVFAMVRNADYCAKLRALGVMPILGNLDYRASLSRIAGLADAVLHFAPPPTKESPLRPPFSKGGTNKNMRLANSSPQRNSHLTSSPPLVPPFVKGGQGGFELQGGFNATDPRTRNLLAILSQGTLPKHFVYISTSGVYGDCGGAIISETHPLNAQTARAQRRIDAEQQIRSWATRNRVHASILRVPGIYAANRLPLDRLRAGTPAIVQEEDSYTNHIHADDLARIVVAALQNAKPNRLYHASDDSQLKMGDYFDAVADAHDLPRPPRLPRAEVERTVSPVLWSFMNESRRLINTRMKRELKVELLHPTVEIKC